MFSLSQSLLTKPGQSSQNKHTVTKVSGQKLKRTHDGKVVKNRGYKELLLSQQEVLLAEGGSQKLNELLTNDKLWGETS